MASIVTSNGKNAFLNRIFKTSPDNTVPSYFVASYNLTAPAGGDDVLKDVISKSQTTIDAMDAITGWTQSGDASAPILNTTTGEFREGSGCLNLPLTHSTGTSAWEKTITSTDLENNFVSLFIYLDNKTALSNVVDAFALVIGTSGFTNSNEYHVSKNRLNSGWNHLGFDISNDISATNGSGATLTTIDRIKLQFKTLSGSYSTNQLRADYISFSTESEILITLSEGYPTFDTGLNKATIRGVVEATEMNEGTPDINKFYILNNDSSKLIISEHTLSSSLSKTNKTRLTITEDSNL